MFTMTYLLFYILMLLALGAVIAFSLFVIKPIQTQWAVSKARKIVSVGGTNNEWQFRNVYRMLATARNDLEAAKLWQQMDEIKMNSGRPAEHNHICVGIIASPKNDSIN